jgi:hypothetical protein
MEQARIIAAANTSAGRTVVRALRILAPGSVPALEPADIDPTPAAAPTGPVRTRETASDGYRRALAAHQQVAPPRRMDPAMADAVERQTAAMRQLSRRAFPESEVVPLEQSHIERRLQATATEAAALRRAREDRAARKAGTAAAVPQEVTIHDLAVAAARGSDATGLQITVRGAA